MPIRKGKPSSRKSKSSARPSSRGRSSSRRPAAPAPRGPTLWERLSPEQRLDVIGVGLIALGLLTLLPLVTSGGTKVTGGWLHLLAGIFGWGMWVFPLALIGFGLWLVLRRIERIPPPSVERITGLVLLFFWLLPTMHYIRAVPQDAAKLAELGQGGGYIGGTLLRLLWLALGDPGLVVALAAWFLVALIMALDISIQDLFRFFGPLFARLRAWIAGLAQRRPGQVPPPGPDEDPGALPGDFTPLPRAGTAAPSKLPAAPPTAGTPVTTVGGPAVHWTLPPIKEVLETGKQPSVNEEFVEGRGRLIEETLASFGAPVQVVEISRGPSITQFGVEPLFVETRAGRTRVRVSRIVALADDLALALAAPRIRIQAPVPGHSYVGIEVPNDEMTLVSLRDILESEAYTRGRGALRFALGRDVSGTPRVSDLTGLPHLLIAGTTGSGKSVCVNSILTCLLLHNTPDDLRLILVDPKRVELTGYNGIPHLLAPVVVEIERVIGALQWMTREMDKRYHQFAQVGARNIGDYNARMQVQGAKKLPYLVIVIDELADLMMIAPDETERTITRLAQLARATGIHLILATQRPSVDVVTGLIKANFPARIAFAVASNTDSRVILDQPGAERLLGRGDMLFQAPDAAAPARLQGVFISDGEIQKLVEYWRAQVGTASPYAIPGGAIDIPAATTGVPLKQAPLFEDMSPAEQGDPLVNEAIDLVRREGRASVSMLQRKLRIGYTRSARLIDTLESKGIVGPPEGQTQVRQVLDYGPAAPPKEKED